MKDCIREFTDPYKRYVQFNDLVIDSTDMITSASYKQDTKTETEEYSFGHGSYYRLPRPQQFLTEAELSITLHIDYRKIPRESRKFLKSFINLQLLKGGKIWAIQDNQLLWAYAFVSSFGEEYTYYKGFYSVDVDFVLPEGIWHIADRQSTYLIPYDSCTFLDEYDFREDDSCGCDCNACETNNPNGNMCWDVCLEKENSLCELYGSGNIYKLFQNCGISQRIVYDCESAKRFFGDNLGVKLSKEDACKSVIAGRFYSNTVIDTDNVEITLTGKWQSPTININGTVMTIHGDYDGTLKIYEDGTVEYADKDCCKFEQVEFDNIEFSDYSFTVHHGENSVIVEGGCCSSGAIYIKADALTN